MTEIIFLQNGDQNGDEVKEGKKKRVYTAETWEGILKLLWKESFFETTLEEYKKELVHRAGVIAGREIKSLTWGEFFKELEEIKLIKILEGREGR